MWIFLLSMLMLTSRPNVAQSPSNSWEMMVYDFDEGRVLTINSTGIQGHANLPAEFLPQDVDQFNGRVAISRDGRYLVGIYSDNGAGVVKIADLNIPLDCCQTLVNPVPSISAFFLGQFDPKNTEVALGYAVTQFTNPDFVPYGGLITVNAETGEITRHLTNFPEESGFPTYLADWTEEGVIYQATCLGCEPPTIGLYHLWNVEQNTTQATARFYDYRAMAYLGDDFLLAEHDPDFPNLPSDGFKLPRNVIKYYHANEVPNHYADDLDNPSGVNFIDGQVVYHDPNNLDLPRPMWVLNGEAFLVASYTSVELVYRDGRREIIPIEAGQTPWTGTPNGWVMVASLAAQNTGELFEYELIDEGFVSKPLGILPANYLILERVKLATPSTGFIQDIAAP